MLKLYLNVQECVQKLTRELLSCDMKVKNALYYIALEISGTRCTKGGWGYPPESVF